MSIVKKQPVVALIYAPPRSLRDCLVASYPTLIMPLGLLYLASYARAHANIEDIALIDYASEVCRLRDNDVPYEQIDYKSFIVDTALKSMKGKVPDVIGISMMFMPSLGFCLDTLRELKALWPNAVVIVGGNHATNDVEALLKEPTIDYVARGEAEIGFADFLTRLDVGSGKVVEGIQGIYSKKDLAEGREMCARCVYPEDLDALPFPAWDLIDVMQYDRATSQRKRSFGSDVAHRMASFLTSRGCPFHCTFCASHSVHGRKMRYRSVPNVTAELRLLHDRYGITLFTPEDDLFTVNKKRTVEMMHAIRDLRIPDFEIQFPNALSVNTLDEASIDALIEGGMKIFWLAIESGSNHVQRNIIKKRVDLDKAVKQIAYAKSKGMYTRANFIFGFPGETREMMEETVEYAKILGADWSPMNIAVPLLGSEFYEELSDMGILTAENREWFSTYAERKFDLCEMGGRELEEFVYRANLKVNFLNNPQFRNGDYALGVELFEDVVNCHPFHIIGHFMILKCYEGLKDTQLIEAKRGEILELYRSNPLSRQMIEKFGDLVPDLCALLADAGLVAA